MLNMRHNFVIFLNIVLISICCTEEDTVRSFPHGFLFGSATSAYQVEGAWNVDGKSINIWDNLTHTRPYLIKDGSNGDIAAKSYYLYARDVEMLRELGVDYYRFSISWARILPTSFVDKINYVGVAYYNNLIDELVKQNIQPMVTIYHWELPQKLQDMGGWVNPYIITWYGDFARLIFRLFGDRVKYWITINEPHQICEFGYGASIFAPAINISGIADYICTKNVLLAHATAYHIYNEEFRSHQNGNIFISIALNTFEPLWPNQTVAAYIANEFNFGQYAHPIFSKTGDFPSVMKTRIARKSSEQGFMRSRLPELSQQEIEFIRGSSDLLGINHYLTTLVYKDETVDFIYSSPSFEDDVGVIQYTGDGSLQDEIMINYNRYSAAGLFKALTMVKEEYDNPPVFITENGFATSGAIIDLDRTQFYKNCMSAMLDAIDTGCDVRAYTTWSLMDNFEWSSGYTKKFGLYSVDFSSPNRTRVPRLSAFFYKDVIKERVLNISYIPDINRPMTIDKGH